MFMSNFVKTSLLYFNRVVVSRWKISTTCVFTIFCASNAYCQQNMDLLDESFLSTTTETSARTKVDSLDFDAEKQGSKNDALNIIDTLMALPTFPPNQINVSDRHEMSQSTYMLLSDIPLLAVISEFTQQYSINDINFASRIAVFTRPSSVISNSPRDISIGLRLGSSSLPEQANTHSYNVLVGYGVAETVELNIGFLSLEDDTRLQHSDFYEGTWYAGFSGRF